MHNLGVFPFGTKVHKVVQIDTRPKKVFVLGVYASAVHATLKDSNGKVLIRALAVASEPYIFWKGEDAETIIKQIDIPAEFGTLQEADNKFNGPSGRALDECFLFPIGLSRNDCWLCDLVPFSMINSSQKNAIHRNLELFDNYKIEKGTQLEATPTNRKIDKLRVQEILLEIINSQADYLITLGNEPIEYFLRTFDKSFPKLDLSDKYGVVQNIKLNDQHIKWLPLVHPRQAARLGNSSEEWFKKHQTWINEEKVKL